MGRLAVAAIVSMWAIPISILVNRVVPEPYMDEIFHIPQAQEYCKGNFRSWDPMITTPPGLYCLSLAYGGSLFPTMSFFHRTLSFPDLCSTTVLRSTNCVLAVICSILVYDIMTTIRPFVDDRKATLTAVVLALYPLHWFFTFLYYTDAASLTAVLAMYLASLKKNYWLSALLGALSIFIRQTNVIWMVFIACAGVIDITLVPQKQKVHDVDEPFIRSTKVIQGDNNADSNLRKRRSNNAMDNVGSAIPTADASLPHVEGLFSEIRHIVLASWHMKWDLLVLFSPFAVILMAFVVFVQWNGSIVLGAKDAHAVSLHFAQIMYFGLVSMLAMAPMHFTLNQAGALFHSSWKNKPLRFFVIFLANVAGFLSVHFFSVAHPYLLADNRHYPFYLWRKVINAHWSAKYLLVPLYACSWLSVFRILGKFQRRIWIMAFFLAIAAVLVPAPLIEFRYFTVPFYILALNSQITDSRSWLLMGFLYAAINMFTMAMFLFRPFKWDHEPGIQRFIW